MRALRNRERAACLGAFAAIFSGILASGGCFNPKIVDGGLLCADGGLCPEGFRCAADGRCKKGTGTTKCQPSSPHIEAICTPDPGNDCDPVCQSRCDCGRCSLTSTGLACVPPGTKKRGDICSPSADDCEPGNICLTDCDGTFGRCYRFCGKGAARHDELCDNGQACDLPVNDVSGAETDLKVCPAPTKACNPAGDGAECGNAGLACYVDGSGIATVCDCKGKKLPGEQCSFFNSCVAGYRCISIGTATAMCVKTCTLGGTDCPTGTCTSVGDSTFGFCPS